MADSDKINTIVNKLLTAKDSKTTQSLYKEWSDTYDSDLDEFGYVAPEISAGLCESIVSKNSRMLDAGCGTGKAGKLLRASGYTNIDGADFSDSMLEHAENLNYYRNTFHFDLSRRLDIKSGTYDAVVSVGVYNNLVQSHFVPELLRITKEKGVLLFTARPKYYSDLMKSIQSEFESGNLGTCEVLYKPYMTGQNANAYYFVMSKSE